MRLRFVSYCKNCEHFQAGSTVRAGFIQCTKDTKRFRLYNMHDYEIRACPDDCPFKEKHKKKAMNEHGGDKILELQKQLKQAYKSGFLDGEAETKYMLFDNPEAFVGANRLAFRETIADLIDFRWEMSTKDMEQEVRDRVEARIEEEAETCEKLNASHKAEKKRIEQAHKAEINRIKQQHKAEKAALVQQHEQALIKKEQDVIRKMTLTTEQYRRRLQQRNVRKLKIE